MYLFDPAHQLSRSTTSQVVPSNWLTLWDDYDWVEDMVAETIRIGAEVLGQEYVVARMGWGTKEVHGRDGLASVDPGDRRENPEATP